MLLQLGPRSSSAQAKINFNVLFKYTAFKRCQEAILKAASKILCCNTPFIAAKNNSKSRGCPYLVFAIWHLHPKLGLPDPAESGFLQSVNDYKEHYWPHIDSFPILQKVLISPTVCTLLH